MIMQADTAGVNRRTGRRRGLVPEPDPERRRRLAHRDLALADHFAGGARWAGQLPDFGRASSQCSACPARRRAIACRSPKTRPPTPDKLIRRAYSIASSSLAREYMDSIWPWSHLAR